MNAFFDANIIVRHLTGDPPDLAHRATRFLAAAGARELRLADLVLAEVVYVLESFYKVPRDQVAESVRAIVAFPAIRTNDPALLLRAIEVYEKDRLDFADAYLVAEAEQTGVGVVASFDKAIDRVDSIRRLVPSD
ncbi:MAG TPA: PIN domain-containing protein [Micromonosporaceae bacterium]|nr:PIN domain-containing protein [Micromonosporaceae bacterium]